jgi:hypothetical protein
MSRWRQPEALRSLRLKALTVASAWLAVSVCVAQPPPPGASVPQQTAPAAAPGPTQTPNPPAESTSSAEPTSRHDDLTALCIEKHAEGQEARMEQRLKDAARAFGICADEGCPQLVREDCIQWQTQATTSAPRVVFQAPQQEGLGDLRVLIDGAQVDVKFGEPMIFDPGPLHLRFEASGRTPVERQLSLRAGAPPTVVKIELPVSKASPRRVIKPKPVPATSASIAQQPRVVDQNRTPALIYILGGVAAGAVGVGTYFAIDAANDRAHALDECAPLCADADVESIDRKLIIADVSFGVGVVSASTALALYLFALDDDRDAEPSPRVSLALAARDMSVSLGGRF